MMNNILKTLAAIALVEVIIGLALLIAVAGGQAYFAAAMFGMI